MTLTIEATYEHGRLTLHEPIALAEGTKVRVTLTPMEAVVPVQEDYDPLEEVIGVCDDGPPISLAARHDEFIYGLKLDEERES